MQAVNMVWEKNAGGGGVEREERVRRVHLLLLPLLLQVAGSFGRTSVYFTKGVIGMQIQLCCYAVVL